MKLFLNDGQLSFDEATKFFFTFFVKIHPAVLSYNVMRKTINLLNLIFFEECTRKQHKGKKLL